MKTALFDIVIAVTGDQETGAYGMTGVLVDRYHTDEFDDGNIIGESEEFQRLDDVIAWAKGAVTAFMEGTNA